MASNLILVKGRITGSRTPSMSNNHWSADGKTTLCGITVGCRVNAMNPAKCISCRKCSRKATKPELFWSSALNCYVTVPED